MKLRNVKITIEIESVEMDQQNPIINKINDPVLKKFESVDLSVYEVRLEMSNSNHFILDSPILWQSKGDELIEVANEKNVSAFDAFKLIIVEFYNRFLKDKNTKSRFKCLWVRTPNCGWKSIRMLDDIDNLTINGFTRFGNINGLI